MYIDAFLTAKEALSPDGMTPDKGAKTAYGVLDALVGWAEKRLMKWQPRSGETEKL